MYTVTGDKMEGWGGGGSNNRGMASVIMEEFNCLMTKDWSVTCLADEKKYIIKKKKQNVFIRLKKEKGELSDPTT